MALPGGDVFGRLLLLVDDGAVGVGLQDDAHQLPAAHGRGDVQRGVAVLKLRERFKQISVLLTKARMDTGWI